MLTPQALSAHPLPPLEANGSKEDRGRVLVIGGTRRTSGAVALAAQAALRAGAGKVQIATSRSAHGLVATGIPEALVIDLPEDAQGDLSGRGFERIRAMAERADALCIGPGLIDPRRARRMLAALVPMASPDATWVLDAAAIYALRSAGQKLLARLGPRTILTPHAGEMAQLLDCDRAAVEASPRQIACAFSARHRCHVVLKGAETVIAAPSGAVVLNRRGNAGLATAGSGDVLAGLVAACAARGASPLSAAMHGVYAHAVAGERLARRIGAAGYLARELLDEVPAVLFAVGSR